jgi:hypothetical protein
VRLELTRTPAADASVQLRWAKDPPDSVLARRQTDSTGSFAFESLATGPYVLRTVRIGTAARVDTVAIGASGGAQLDMELHQIAMDECGYAVTMVKRPWWRFW